MEVIICKNEFNDGFSAVLCPRWQQLIHLTLFLFFSALTMSLLQQQLATYGINIDTSTYPLTEFKYPSFGILFYLLAVFYLQPNHATTTTTKNATKKSDKKSITTLKLFICAHNIILCIFSGLCFYRTFPVVASVYYQYGYENAACRQLPNMYAEGTDGVFGYWVYLFYLSKMYEFIDTFIVIARGRRPMFLQKFHHVGATLVCFSDFPLFDLYMCLNE